MAEKEEREVAMSRGRRKRRILKPVIRRYRYRDAYMEDVDSESGSQNGLRGVDVKDPANEKEKTMVPWRFKGSQGKRIVADVCTINKPFPYNNSNC